MILQEMSHGPLTSRNSFLKNAGRLCAWIREEGATPLLFATWAYQEGSQALADQDHFRTSVSVCLSPTFYGWVFQWEGRIRIEGPEKAVTGYKEMVKKATSDAALRKVLK